MQELKALILHKINFMRSYQQKQMHQNTMETQSQLLHLLLLQKKKMHFNQSIQSKIMHSLLNNTIQAPYRLLQFYEQSKLIMKVYNTKFCSDSDDEQQYQSKSFQQQQNQLKKQQQTQFKLQKHLASNVISKSTLIFKTIKLYQKFFISENNQIKGEQIYHLYKKKLCPSGLLLPTIFCWFSEWIKKQFTSFLKDNIKLLTKTNIKNSEQPISLDHGDQHQKTKENNRLCRKKVEMQQKEQMQSSILKSQSSKQQLYKNIEFIKIKKQINEKKRLNLPIFMTIQIQKTEREHLKHQNFPLKKKSSQINFLSERNTIEQAEEKIAINKQIVVGAYYDQFSSYYKSLQSSIPDLDFQFIRQIKRNDRKTQIKKKIREISRIFAINQASIKVNIQKFILQYKSKQQLIQQKKAKRHKRKYNQNDYQTCVQQEILTKNENIQSSKTQQLQNLKSLQLDSNLLKNKTSQTRRKLIRQNKQIEQRKQLCKSFQMSLNLPKIPQNSKNSSILKGKSKIVLINSGRYKFQTDELNRRKLTSKSIDLGNIKQRQKDERLFELQQLKIQNKSKKLKMKLKDDVKLIDKLIRAKQNPEQTTIKKYQRQLISKIKIKKKKKKSNLQAKQATQSNLFSIQKNGEFQTIDYKIQGWSQSY